MTTATLTPQKYLQAQSRWHALEIAFWLATLLPFVLFPDYLSLASQIAITALFALSLDLILGYAGIVSLGHAAFFGIGAYTAGLFSKFIWGEPLTGLILAAAVAGLVGFAVSFIVSRFRHFTLIMITLGLGLLAFEAANRAHWLTGGSDGLQGVSIWPVLGIFKFDLYGYTAYAYSLATLFVVFLGARRLVNSPFGLALRGIRENWVRMPAIGADSRAHIRKAFTLAAASRRARRRGAGADHGERFARIHQLPALRRRAGDAGAGGRRTALWRVDRRHDFHGGARPVLRDCAAILVFLDRRSAGDRRHGAAERHPRRADGPLCAVESEMTAIALATRGLSKAFGSLPVARDIAINLPVGARYALIGPNGAGKTTLINLMTGMLTPNAGQILLEGEDITALGPQERVRRGLARTFQINTLFAGLNALEAVTLAVAERRNLAGQFWRSVGSYSEAIDEAYEILRKLKLGDDCYQITRELPYGRQRLLEIALALATKPKVLLLDEPAAGVPQEESGEVFEAVAGLSDDLTLLFIEHDMHVVFRFATHIIVLVGGAIFTEGSPAEIAADPGVREVYLGKRKHG